MSQYAKLDQLITQTITSTGVHLSSIYCIKSGIHQECARLGTEMGQEPFRIVDRRLQALRKSGVISYNRKIGWTKTDLLTQIENSK